MPTDDEDYALRFPLELAGYAARRLLDRAAVTGREVAAVAADAVAIGLMLEDPDANAGDALRGITDVLQRAALGEKVDSYLLAHAAATLMDLTGVGRDEIDDCEAVCERIRRGEIGERR